MSTVVEELTRLGAVARWGQLRRRSSWRLIAAALDEGTIVRTSQGRYALPTADKARQAASDLTGTCSHLSAAAHWEWPVKTPPALPHVTVSSNRRVARARRAKVALHWRTLDREEVDGWVTTKVRTVIDCCLDLPFDEALAVFDSSWRSGLKPRDVQIAAQALPRRQKARLLAVAAAADSRAANAFESVLRAIALRVPGLTVEPQVVIKDGALYARVDLADQTLKIVLEAEGFEFHGKRKALEKDCRRYDELVVRGWLVLRFSWEQVMSDPEWVAEMIRLAVTRRQQERRRTQRAVAA